MGVIRQNGGISLGSNGNSLVKFSTGKQFAINDQAVLQVRLRSIHFSCSIGTCADMRA